MIAYVSGPMRGIPGLNRKSFADAGQALAGLGICVLNPAMLPWGLGRAAALRIDAAMVAECDAVVQLPGWEESEGARLEAEWAREHGKPCIALGEALSLAPAAAADPEPEP